MRTTDAISVAINPLGEHFRQAADSVVIVSVVGGSMIRKMLLQKKNSIGCWSGRDTHAKRQSGNRKKKEKQKRQSESMIHNQNKAASCQNKANMYILQSIQQLSKKCSVHCIVTYVLKREYKKMYITTA